MAGLGCPQTKLDMQDGLNVLVNVHMVKDVMPDKDPVGPQQGPALCLLRPAESCAVSACMRIPCTKCQICHINHGELYPFI